MAFARLYEVFIRKSLGSDNPIVRPRADRSAPEAPHGIARDKFTLRVWLLDDGATPLDPMVGAQIASGDQETFAGRARDNLAASDALFSAASSRSRPLVAVLVQSAPGSDQGCPRDGRAGHGGE